MFAPQETLARSCRMSKLMSPRMRRSYSSLSRSQQRNPGNCVSKTTGVGSGGMAQVMHRKLHTIDNNTFKNLAQHFLVTSTKIDYLVEGGWKGSTLTDLHNPGGWKISARFVNWILNQKTRLEATLDWIFF